MPTDKKKYPKYTGKNSLSASENSWHLVNSSLPENLKRKSDSSDSKTGIIKKIIPQIHAGIFKTVHFSFIAYIINIQEVAFAVNKILNI